MPHNKSNHDMRRPGDTVGLCYTSGQGTMTVADTQTTFCVSHLPDPGLFSMILSLKFNMHSLISYSEVTVVEVVSDPSVLEGTATAHLKYDL